jgi:riboflavin kinase/FMN adenylyltransferase
MAIFTYALHDAMPLPCRGGVLAIGNFDGVHRGHQSLLVEATRQARALFCCSVAVTFDPHPLQLLRPERLQPFLTTLQDRTALLQQYDVDHVLVLKTEPALLQLTARAFFEQIIVEALQARAMVEGYSFAFGRGREGTPEVLKALCTEKKVGLNLLPPCEVLGKPVSSSRVRDELVAGNVAVAQQLLGRPYRIHGIVATGQKRGASLGFPTANLHEVPTLIPGNGVYAVRAVHQEQIWPAAANVGPNPTFGEDARKIEVHLIGYQGDLYGQELAVDFIERIRPTRAFANVQELVAQIQADVEAAKRSLHVT